jgi:uncharacterized protein YaiE (UPF0345 family)
MAAARPWGLCCLEILEGELEILLPAEKSWRVVKSGETFEVPANSKFGLKVKTVTDYCCSYISSE